MEKVPMTPQGHQVLMDELRNLREVERPRIIEDLAEARSHGDLKENAEYHAARERQSFNEGRIQELESVLTRVEVIDYTKFSNDIVRFGATVHVYDEQTEQTCTYKIVGHYEADITQNKLSLQAPLSRALISKAKGDVSHVSTPGGQKTYEILEISYVNSSENE